MTNSATFEQLPAMVDQLRAEIEWIKQYLIQTESFQTSKQNPGKFLSVKEAADFLGLATQSVYGLVCRKQIPYMKQMKRLYFSRSELQSWVEAGRRKTHEEIIAETRPIHVKKGGSHV